MTFLEKINTIERVDALIKRKATGTSKEFATRLDISRRCVFNILNVMKSLGAPIVYCHNRRTFMYEYECELVIGFVDKKDLIIN